MRFIKGIGYHGWTATLGLLIGVAAMFVVFWLGSKVSYFTYLLYAPIHFAVPERDYTRWLYFIVYISGAALFGTSVAAAFRATRDNGSMGERLRQLPRFAIPIIFVPLVAWAALIFVGVILGRFRLVVDQVALWIMVFNCYVVCPLVSVMVRSLILSNEVGLRATLVGFDKRIRESYAAFDRVMYLVLIVALTLAAAWATNWLYHWTPPALQSGPQANPSLSVLILIWSIPLTRLVVYAVLVLMVLAGIIDLWTITIGGRPLEDEKAFGEAGAAAPGQTRAASSQSQSTRPPWASGNYND